MHIAGDRYQIANLWPSSLMLIISDINLFW